MGPIEPRCPTGVLDSFGRGAEIEIRGPLPPELQPRAAACVLDRCQEQLERARNECAIGPKVLLARLAREIEDAGVHAERADLIAHDDIGGLRKTRQSGRAAHDRDAIAEAARVRDAAGEARDRLLLDRVDPRGASAARENAEDAGARREIDDDRTRSDEIGERPRVGSEAMRVFEVGTVLVEVRQHVYNQRNQRAAVGNAE